MTAGARILVAEADESLQSRVKRALERDGYLVTQAFSRDDLYRVLAVAHPDVIVLDVSLPDADGRDVLSALKRDPTTTEIPIVVWSRGQPQSERRIALELGAEDYVEQGPPFELVQKIGRVLLRLSQRLPLA
jgi:two-component system KDP operon response regulator KdpE